MFLLMSAVLFTGVGSAYFCLLEGYSAYFCLLGEGGVSLSRGEYLDRGPPLSTAAVGTHPTRMHSCLIFAAAQCDALNIEFSLNPS